MSLPPINRDSIRNYDRSTQIFFRRSSPARFHTLNEDSWGQLHLTLLSECICLCTRIATFNVYVYMFIYFSVHIFGLVQCGGILLIELDLLYFPKMHAPWPPALPTTQLAAADSPLACQFSSSHPWRCNFHRCIRCNWVQLLIDAWTRHFGTGGKFLRFDSW